MFYIVIGEVRIETQRFCDCPDCGGHEVVRRVKVNEVVEAESSDWAVEKMLIRFEAEWDVYGTDNNAFTAVPVPVDMRMRLSEQPELFITDSFVAEPVVFVRDTK